jgi:hypothetical protein
VFAGFALGAVMERLLRLWTGYPNRLRVLKTNPSLGRPRENPGQGMGGALLRFCEKR